MTTAATGAGDLLAPYLRHAERFGPCRLCLKKGNIKLGPKAPRVYRVEHDCLHETARRALEGELAVLSRDGLPEKPAAWQRRFVRRLKDTRAVIPPPVDLTWLPEVERERILDERGKAFAEHHLLVRALVEETLQALLAPLQLTLERRRMELGLKARAAPATRRSREETQLTVRRLLDEGYVIAAVADMTGLAEATVRRYGRGRNGATSPHGYAADPVPSRGVDIPVRPRDPVPA